jgi:2-polyprenyl-3-methyl-5-hydroxy-6-metoxy-1,4-benzoquinol methylase
MVSYNEATAIRPVLAEIDEAATVLRRSGITLDVLLVDDGSPDETARIAVEEAQRLGLSLEVVTGEPQGPGNAFLRGFEHALIDAPDFLVTLDSDGQHDARQMPDLVRAFLARGSGMTIGSRWVRGGRSPGTPMHRTALSLTGNFLTRRVTGLRGVRDSTTSFRVIRPEVVTLFKPHDLSTDGYGFFSSFAVLTQANGFSIDEVPITFRPRYSGVSKLTSRQMVDFLANLFALRRQVKKIRHHHLDDQASWAQRSARFQFQGEASHASYNAMAELQALSSATRFFDWIVAELKPALGKEILEVGAGIGTVSRRLADQSPISNVLAIEPASEPFAQLKQLADEHPRIEARQATSSELVDDGTRRFDTIVYVNVLEHIEDDVGELTRIRPLLREGGSLCIFVPAAPRAYGSMDYISGHYRRYRKDGLRSVLAEAGFVVEDLRHFDVVGLVPYWLVYRLLDVNRFGGASSAAFDRVLVPMSRAVQSVFNSPPAGKNLIAVARLAPQ